MYVSMYIHNYVRIYNICIYLCMYIRTVCLCFCLSLCVLVCVCMCMCVCVCVCVCVRAHACISACVLSQDGHFSSNFSPVAVILLTLSLPNFTNVLLAARRKLRNVCKETKAGRYQTPTTIFHACTGLWLAHTWFLKIA